MPMDWKLNNEFNEVWHSSIWRIFLLQQPKNWIFIAKKWILDFDQKYEIHILVKNTIFPSSFSIVV